MQTTFVLGTIALVVGLLILWAIESTAGIGTRGRTGAPSLGSRRGPEISPVLQPSIEQSKTNSTASITVPANPDRPLAYTVEPWNGSARLRVLTVVYEQSLDASESATLRSVDSDSRTPSFDSPDDPSWLAHINQRRGTL